MHRNIFSNLLILFVMTLTVSSCSDPGYKGNGGNGTESPYDDIDVKAGMTLVGILTYDDGKPIVEAVVSDGYSSTLTDSDGIYQIKRNAAAKYVLVSLPADCKLEMIDGRPNFYASINQNQEIWRSDFRFTRITPETSFALFAVADPQTQTTAQVARFKQESIPDYEAEAATFSIPVYGMTLGDIVWNKPELMSVMHEAISGSSLVTLNTIGNHDHTPGITDDQESQEEYETYFGPTYYSLNRGDAHIVVVDNIIFRGSDSEFSRTIDTHIMNWFRSDLSHVDPDKLLIVCMHAPLDASYMGEEHSAVAGTSNNTAVKTAVSQFRDVHILAGHTHININDRLADNIFQHTTGAVCGAWWAGHLNGCGTPNGYGVYLIEGNRIANHYYKGTGRHRDRQMWLYDKGAYGFSADHITVNVWNYSEEWSVELWEDMDGNGTYTKTGDFGQIYGYDRVVQAYLTNLGWSGRIRQNKHMLQCEPRSASSEKKVVVRDIYGNVYEEDRFLTNLSSYDIYD